MTNQHINVASALADGVSHSESAHLAACEECRSKLASAREAFASLRSIDKSLERVPESFWEQQRRAIRVRAAEAKPQRPAYALYGWLATAAAVAVISVGLLLPDRGEKQQLPSASTDVSDAALLESVQDSIYEYPEALHPAQLMYTEIATAQATPQRK
jgi:predicted anti-sigma-YlaC factor YlaD